MKFFLVCCCMLSILGFTQVEEVKNTDQPERGKWRFSPHINWKIDAAGEYILSDVRSIKIDEKGNIYILDEKPNHVHVVDHSGKHLFSFAKRGEGPGELKHPYELFLLEDYVVVPDLNKIHYFSRLGEYKKSLQTTEMFMAYLMLNEDEIVAFPFSSLEKDQRDVQLYNLKTKKKRQLFKIPKFQALRYSKGGSRLILRMPFVVAEDLMITGNSGCIYYGYSKSYDIKKINSSGKMIKSFSIQGREREKISKADKLKILDRILEMHRNVSKNVLNKMADQIPDKLPFFHHLYTDDAGLIYVMTARIKESNRRDVDIFSKQGKYLYRGNIILENGFNILRLALRNKIMVVMVEGPDGERLLVKYTLVLPRA